MYGFTVTCQGVQFDQFGFELAIGKTSSLSAEYMIVPRPICLTLLRSEVFLAAILA